MFVCILHCSAASLIKEPVMQMAGHGSGMLHHKSRNDKNDCDCCKHHGNFTIKENIKPGADFQLSQTIALVKPLIRPAYLVPTSQPISDVNLWVDDKAPPWESGRSISIKFRSLLI